MSIALAPTDLSSLAVGQSTKIPLSAIVISAAPLDLDDPHAHLLIHNESGSGIKVGFDGSANTFNLPAGGWRIATVEPGLAAINIIILYKLPNPPVQLFLVTYYDVNEEVPDAGVLGNSPIGIGGTIQTSSIQSLSNEGSVLGTKIVDIGTLTIGDLLDIFNDHFLWKVQQSGVAHQVLKGQTSGNPLQIGQGGDISEVLGNLLVDGTLTAESSLVVDSSQANDVTLSQSGKSVHVQGQLFTDQNLVCNAEFFANGFTNLNPTGLVDNGDTSGSATMYQLLVGNVKLVVIFQANFKQVGAAINRALPTPFTASNLIWASGVNGFSLMSSGVAQSLKKYTAIGAGGFTTSASTAPGPNTLLDGGVCDAIQYSGGNAGAANGIIFIIGI